MIEKKGRRPEDDYGEIDNVSPSQDKKLVECKYCHFKFKANFSTRTPKTCPYCGRPFFADV